MADARPRRLAAEFARWMRTHLGYQSVQTNVLVTERAAPARMVGIRGETYRIAWYRLRFVALGLFAIGLLLRAIVPVSRSAAPILPTALFYLSVAGYLAAHVGRLRTRRYAWVECKDRKRPVRRGEVQQLADAVSKMRESEAASWKADRVIVVARSHGFEGEALALARSLSIDCYRRTASGFERDG
jgi:hypothetical protein